MRSLMCSARRQERQVVRSVVVLDAVDVVDEFTVSQRSAQTFLHNLDVLPPLRPRLASDEVAAAVADPIAPSAESEPVGSLCHDGGQSAQVSAKLIQPDSSSVSA